MKEAFIDRKFSAESLALISVANDIMADYAQQGYKLTLRQLYYQFVAKTIIPNKQTEYKRLGSVINDARLAGLIDWDSIEDRTRELETITTWNDPQEILTAIGKQYKADLWKTQMHRVEIWIEKEALVGVVERVARLNRVPYFACRGYCSASEAYVAATRIVENDNNDQGTIILHLGDHDPSGIDMTRDNLERLELLSHNGNVEMRRLALNRDQVDELNLPPNPAKLTDSRFGGYAAIHGDESWELDALSPAYINKLVQREIDGIRDKGKWRIAKEAEADQRALLMDCAQNWDDVSRFLQGEVP